MPSAAAKGSGDLDVVDVTDLTGTAVARVYLFGGQVTSLKIAGTEKLFMSPMAYYDGVKPMRGGIPLVFPQFGMNGPLPQHGFARNSVWKHISTNDDATATVAQFELADSPATRAVWDHAFRLVLSVRVTSSSLRVTLAVRNTGAAEFSFAAVLHTYLRVAEIETTAVEGFEGHAYRDNKRNGEAFTETGPVAFVSETERIFASLGNNTAHLVEAGRRTASISSDNCPDCVLWNPWVDKSKALVDFPDDGYHSMVCIEPGSGVAAPATLAAGAEVSLSQTIEFL